MLSLPVGPRPHLPLESIHPSVGGHRAPCCLLSVTRLLPRFTSSRSPFPAPHAQITMIMPRLTFKWLHAPRVFSLFVFVFLFPSLARLRLPFPSASFAISFLLPAACASSLVFQVPSCARSDRSSAQSARRGQQSARGSVRSDARRQGMMPRRTASSASATAPGQGRTVAETWNVERGTTMAAVL